MKKQDIRSQNIIERKKRFSLSIYARQKASRLTEYSDVELTGWSPDIKARKLAVYKAQKNTEQKIQGLIDQCCAEHPDIGNDPNIRGGLPHIRGSRITVQYILDRLSVHGTVKGVVKILPHITEAQIKDAIAYARDFMEKACGQLEVND
jgi:uncharacterized protein (DUF433 family)